MTYEKKFKWTFAALIVMVALNAVTLTMIWSGPPETPEWTEPAPPNGTFNDRGSVRMYMKNQLGLNDTQLDSINALRRRHFREMRAMRQDLENLRQTYFDTLMQDGQAEQAVLDSLVREMSSKSAAIEQSMSRHMVEINQYLDGDQRRKFGRMMQNMMHHDRRRGGNRPFRNRQN